MKSLLPYLLILLFALIGLRSLIESPFYTSHDGFTHTARIAAYTKILKDNQIPPRWAADLNSKLGSPIFVYSYPLPYLLGSGIHFLGVPYEDCFRIIMGLSFTLGSFGMYFWLKKKYDVFPALVGAIFYMFVPYRFLNLYVRAAFAESFAYAILPFIFLTIENQKTSKNSVFWWSLTAILTGFLLLSHNVVAAMFLPIIFAWIIISFWPKWVKVAKLTLTLVFGFLMSSFIYFPDFLERSFIRFDQGISYYPDHFVGLFQLIRSPWGYGFDLPGTVNDAMSFQLGLANLLVLALLVVLIIKNRHKTSEIFFLIALLAIVLILMVQAPYSLILWKTIPMLRTIVDFPWRLLGVTAFIFAILAAYLIKITPYKIGTVVLLIFAVLISNRNFMRVNEKQSFDDVVFDNYTGSGTATSNEYQPIFDKTNEHRVSENLNIISRNSNSLVFTSFEAHPKTVNINRYYFPNTVVYQNGKVTKSWKIAKNGTINLKVSPPGGTYEVKFLETPLRNFANILSGGTFVALLTVLVLSKVKKK